MTTLSIPLVDAIAEGVRQGLPVGTAATLAGSSKQAASNWVQAVQSGGTHWSDGSPVSDDARAVLLYFWDAIERARAERAAKALESINEAAETVGKSGVREWRAAAWLLEHAPDHKRDWGQQVTIEQTGSVDHRLQLVQALPDAELLQLASPEMQALLAPLPANDATNQPDNDTLPLDRGSDYTANHDERLPQLPQ